MLEMIAQQFLNEYTLFTSLFVKNKPSLSSNRKQVI